MISSHQQELNTQTLTIKKEKRSTLKSISRVVRNISAGVFAIMLAAPGMASAANPWTFTPSGKNGFTILDEDLTPLTEMHASIHGAGWKWAVPKNASIEENGVNKYQEIFKEPFGEFEYKVTITPAGDGNLVLEAECTALTDTEFTGAGLLFNATRGQTGAQIEFDAAKDGKKMPLPFKGTAMIEQAARAVTTFAGESNEVIMEFSPPIDVHIDRGSARFWFFTGKIPAGETRKQRMTLAFSKPIKLNMTPQTVDTSNWFPLAIKNDHSPGSPLGMEEWIEKPAGKHGFVQMKGKDFVFEDGTPAKFWGVNLVNLTPTEEIFDKWARRLAKYGVNIARIVAFGRPNNDDWAHYVKIQDVEDGMNFSDEAMKLFDYGFAALKKEGIYAGFSPFYGWYPTPGDKARFIDFDELMKVLRKDFPSTNSFYGITCIAPDVQDAYIEFIVRLLNHVNPHTGKRYADDPALAWVELMNEENTYLQLFDLQKILDQVPTYKKLYYEKFAAWLKNKYGDRESLAKAWGNALLPEENIEEANITPCPTWFNQPNKRQADQMAFIYDNQLAFYKKFEEKVRATGYKGAIDGSCWQAAEWVGHLYNLKLDSDIGFIDRHNYGGNPMLCDPGTGLLSCGMQQVGNRPFNASEWAYGVPVAEEVPIMAIYGMGLQGWDGSQQFASHSPDISLYYSGDVNHVCDQFENIAQYPAVARMLYRGDIKEGDVAASRRVSFPQLLETGDVGFREEFSLLGHANHKEFSSVIPQGTLAVGRVTLDFVDGPVADPIVTKYEQYLDPVRKEIRSNTGQLLWSYRGHGYITADTPGTQAVIGFAGGNKFSMADVDIELLSEFACLYVSARNPKETLANAKQILITALGRAVNKGTTLDAVTLRLLSGPDAPENMRWNKPYWEANHPLIIEPVTAQIVLKNRKIKKVVPLDHDGLLPEGAQSLPVKSQGAASSFLIDGNQTKTVYYLVECE